MLYYKVNTGDKHDYFTGNTTIKNELLTEKERNTKFRYLTDEYFTPVNISRKNVYFSFGARFERGSNHNK